MIFSKKYLMAVISGGIVLVILVFGWIYYNEAKALNNPYAVSYRFANEIAGLDFEDAAKISENSLRDWLIHQSYIQDKAIAADERMPLLVYGFVKRFSRINISNEFDKYIGKKFPVLYQLSRRDQTIVSTLGWKDEIFGDVLITIKLQKNSFGLWKVYKYYSWDYTERLTQLYSLNTKKRQAFIQSKRAENSKKLYDSLQTPKQGNSADKYLELTDKWVTKERYRQFIEAKRLMNAPDILRF